MVFIFAPLFSILLSLVNSPMNRPSRIIPRVEIHTTQDVTVEILKPEGEAA